MRFQKNYSCGSAAHSIRSFFFASRTTLQYGVPILVSWRELLYTRDSPPYEMTHTTVQCKAARQTEQDHHSQRCAKYPPCLAGAHDPIKDLHPLFSRVLSLFRYSEYLFVTAQSVHGIDGGHHGGLLATYYPVDPCLTRAGCLLLQGYYSCTTQKVEVHPIMGTCPEPTIHHHHHQEPPPQVSFFKKEHLIFLSSVSLLSTSRSGY